MILGVGSDLIDIRRIEKTIERFGDRFLDRIFTENERRRCDRRNNRVASYARRFAAKEAAAKALGTGFRRGVFWRDLGVVNLPSGQPSMLLTGGALRRLEAYPASFGSISVTLLCNDIREWLQALETGVPTAQLSSVRICVELSNE